MRSIVTIKFLKESGPQITVAEIAEILQNAGYDTEWVVNPHNSGYNLLVLDERTEESNKG